MRSWVDTENGKEIRDYLFSLVTRSGVAKASLDIN